jgi:hypothetical protein
MMTDSKMENIFAATKKKVFAATFSKAGALVYF